MDLLDISAFGCGTDAQWRCDGIFPQSKRKICLLAYIYVFFGGRDLVSFRLKQGHYLEEKECAKIEDAQNFKCNFWHFFQSLLLQAFSKFPIGIFCFFHPEIFPKRKSNSKKREKKTGNAGGREQQFI